jgi:molecular chaperone DnaK
MTVMIQRNTTIPTQKKEIFSTAADSQPSVEVHVLQGERTEARYNRTLGKFSLDGIPPAPRGIPKVEVTFDIDANGILNVTAKDTATGREQTVVIKEGSGLSENEVDRMVNEAKEHEEEDKKKREEIERRNKLDTLCYTLEKTITDNKDKVSDEDKKTIEAAIVDSRKAIEEQDDAKVQSCLESLEKEAHRVASAMYEQAGGGKGGEGGEGGGNDAGAPPEGKDDGVIDAEFEETN